MDSVSKLLIPIICLLLMSYFGYHGLHGRYGYLAQQKLGQQLVIITKSNDKLKQQKSHLEHRISLLKADSISKDLLDELARKTLNLSHENDAIIWSNAKK